MDGNDRICFGDFVMDRVRGRLEDRDGSERFLRPKSYRVLELLCERRGRLVSKDELIGEAWPGVFVTEDSLAHCVSDIRRALGPKGAMLLRTVPRRGYVLSAAEPQPGAPVRRLTGARMVMVSGLVVALAVGVVWWTMPRGAVEAAPEITASTLQEAEVLLEARDWRQRELNERARRLLEQVVADDPEDSDALASLGLTYWLEVQHLAWGGGRRELERALGLVERSVAFGGSDRSHRLLAEMRLLAPFRELRSPVDALASARAAYTINPDSPDNMAVLAQALALSGRPKEAIGMIERALRLRLRPRPPQWHQQIAGLAYLLAGEPARAAEQLGPLYGAGTFANARWWPGWFYVASLAHGGRIDDAAAVVRAAKARRPERSISAVAQSLDGFADEAGLGLVLEGLRLAGMPG